MISNGKKDSRTAFVSIVGCPNVGKSSIINSIVGQKVSIVSHKPQTTRNRILGILNSDEVQIVFMDTPGLHKPFTRLGEMMVESAKGSINDSDICILVVDASRSKIEEQELKVIRRFKEERSKDNGFFGFLVINKIDKIRDKSVIIDKIKEYSDLFKFDAVIPLSAKSGKGIGSLISEIKSRSFESPHFFDDNLFTDQSEKAIVSEIIREKILTFLDKEIPHGTAVIIDRMREREGSKVSIMDIDATILCEKSTHKGIIIGKGGKMLKRIASSARIDIERFFDIKVNLQVWIKIKEDWRNKESVIKSLE